jgi:putative addiction module component (TIGR02574 family)
MKIKGCTDMLKTDELIDEAMSLPVELRAQLADKLLKSLNPAQAEIDRLWALEAEKRVANIKSGRVQPIRGEEVFEKIRKRLNQ